MARREQASARAAAAERLNRRLTLIVVILPLVGFVLAVAGFWGAGVGPVELGILAGLYLFTGFGITIGYHRLFSHGAFKAGPVVRGIIGVAGAMALQGPIIRWVADHRKHHRFSDKEGDVHSPHLHGRGLWNSLKGIWWAHTGWLLTLAGRGEARKYAPDLLRDPVVVWVDRHYLLWVVATLALPAFLGFLFTGTAAGAGLAFLWGGLVRLFLVHHVTWGVNSICHFFGDTPWETHDESRNNVFLSIVSLGESWHNTHHAFPFTAHNDLRWWQIDPSAWVIRALTVLGLAWDVKRPTGKMLERHARGDGGPMLEA